MALAPLAAVARRFILAALWVSGLAILPDRALAQSCTTISPPCPSNEKPRVTISPRENVGNASSILVTVSVMDDRAMGGSPNFNPSLSGETSTSTGGNTSYTYTGTLALSNGSNTFIVLMTDDDGQTSGDTVVFAYDAGSSPPAQGPPSLNPYPHSSTVRSVAGCSGCLYGGASYSTPAYVSRDVSRSVTLIYSSAQALPRGLVMLDATVNTSTTPTGIQMQLNQGGAITLTNGGTSAWYSGTTGTIRVGAQFDASGLATGVHRYTAYVTNWWSGSSYQSSVPVRVFVINEASSVFGAGWTVAGLKRLVSAGGDSVALTSGAGDITFYKRTSSTTFWTDSGAIAPLTSSGGVYTLTGSDGSWVRFNSSGFMTAAGTRFNDSTAYAYDGSNRISTITDEVGRTTTFTYAPNGICPSGSVSGTLCAITTPGGRVSKFVVNLSNDLVQIIDPDGVTAFTGTYWAHQLTSSTDRLGSSTTLAYDSFTGLSSVTAQSVTTTTTAGSTTTESPVTTYQSIEAALLSTSNTSSGAARAPVLWSAAYAKITAPNGAIARMVLQGTGEPLWTDVVPVSGATRTTHIGYDVNYLPTSSSEQPVGGSTRYTWSGDKLTSVVDPFGTRTDIHYHSSYGQPDTIRVNGFIQQLNYYSGTPFKLDSTKAGTAKTTFTWDSQGRLTATSNMNGWTTSFSYSGSGFDNRSQVSPFGAPTTFRHDAYGRDSIAKNYLGDSTITLYDVLNRVTSTIQRGPATTAVSVSENTSAHTATVSVTDPRSLVFSSVGNALGWTTSVTDPHSNASTAGYDKNGFLRRAVNRAGGVVTASYDSLGRPISITANGNTTSFAYDAATLASSPHWTVGATTDSRDSVNTDAQGRPTSIQTIRGGLSFTLTNFYNARGDRSRLKIAGPSWTDSLMFATDEHSYPFQLPDFGYKWTRVHYSPERLVDTVRFDSGLLFWTLPTNYSGHRRPTDVDIKVSGNVHTHWRYSYDVLGRLTRADTGDFDNDDYYSREYTYDARGRLASYADKHHYRADSTREPCPPPEIICDPMPPWEYTPGTTTIRSASYTPDYSGNRTDGSASLTNDRLGSMTGANGVSYSFTYDNEGRRTAKTASGYSQTYGWNDLGQLTWVKTNGDSVAYGYDAAGRRVRKYSSVGSATTHYLWDGDNLLMELDGSGNRVRRYAYHPGIDRPVSITTSSGTFNYELDVEGNVRGLWNSSPTRLETYKYDPYGWLVDSSGTPGQPLLWKGRERDKETGLYYMRARYYDPVVGRFISEDPIGLAGGINPYTFADGEPVNNADPSGLAPPACPLNTICSYADAPPPPRAQGIQWSVDFLMNQLADLLKDLGNSHGAGRSRGGSTGNPSKKVCSEPAVDYQISWGGSAIIGGGAPAAFVGGGLGFGFTRSGRVFGQVQLGASTGVGAYASAGTELGVAIGTPTTGVSGQTIAQVNAGLGGSGGMAVSRGLDGNWGASVSLKAGKGWGAMAALGQYLQGMAVFGPFRPLQNVLGNCR